MTGGCGKSSGKMSTSYSPKKAGASFPKPKKMSPAPRYTTHGGFGHYGSPKVKVSFGRRGY